MRRRHNFARSQDVVCLRCRYGIRRDHSSAGFYSMSSCRRSAAETVDRTPKNFRLITFQFDALAAGGAELQLEA